MAFTDDSDLFGSLDETGLNRIARHMLQQRPSLFNYATRFFITQPDRLCQRIDAHPEVVRRGNPLITEEEPLPIPGFVTPSQYPSAYSLGSIRLSSSMPRPSWKYGWGSIVGPKDVRTTPESMMNSIMPPPFFVGPSGRRPE